MPRDLVASFGEDVNNWTEDGCSACGFALWIPLTRLATTAVGLYDDRRFPGRCLVVLREHYDHLSELPDETLVMFVRDVQLVGRAVQALPNVHRVNYAVLGNAEPHVHAHVIPRSPGEPHPDRAPWEHPDTAEPMDASDHRVVTDALLGFLANTS